MSLYLKGDQYDQFRDAFERAVLDFAEAASLMHTPPKTVDDWACRLSTMAEVWERHGIAMADMVKAATGEDVRRFFTPQR